MTQKYEPVEWTDETPTQPGTLINKARLDQMQSAHHYADGFEEVDAIPTEDPGTAYHKVVYCTADSTFYRWDGAQWTADIDDDTKRLLEEHEADHANPHQVTKAQVGLGNADNTSDANKPVSTAQAAAIGAVQSDLDAHEANRSNPHQVTKAQVGLGNADNTSDADKPISTATQTALDGKVDKLGSSPAGSYTKVTVNAQGQVTAGSNPTTLAEAGIADAYTKAQVDTKLGDGSVTKLGTADVGSDTLPIKLVGGVPTPVADALAKDSTVVHLTGAETISNIKTFTSDIHIKKVNPEYSYMVLEDNIPRTTLPSAQRRFGIRAADSNGTDLGQLAIWNRTDGGKYLVFDTFPLVNGTPTYKRADIIRYEPDGTGYMTAPVRTYDPTHTSDVVTLGLLDQYTPMVRTTGNQVIDGLKEYNVGAYLKPIISIAVSTAGYIRMARIKAGGSPRTVHGTMTSTYQNVTQFHIEFWLSNWNSSSIGYAKSKSTLSDNSRLRVTVDASGNWDIWFKPNTASQNTRALLYFNEVLINNYIAGLYVETVPQESQAVVAEDDPSWANLTIVNVQEWTA